MFVHTLLIAAAALSAVSAAPAPANYFTTVYSSPEPTTVAGNEAKEAAVAPTTTSTDAPSKTVSLTGVTHTVAVGRGGLKFDPDNVVAEIGDLVEWHFLPANHSVFQSSFDRPCQPRDGEAFSSGFFPIQQGQSPEVFQIVVQDKTPIWYYCAQTKGKHCQNGMVGVINQNFDSPSTLARHRELAANTTESIALPAVQGGWRIPNPNPLNGL